MKEKNTKVNIEHKKENEKENQKENLENNGKNVKEKIIPAYQRKDEPKNKKLKKKPDKKVIKSRITIAIIIFVVVLVGLAIFGIVSLVNNNKYKPYRKYEETMKVYGFDKMYDNNSADTGESVTKSEAVKIILSCVLNTSDITEYNANNEEYKNSLWVDYARYRGIIGSADINKDNADDKATYIEVIRYIANAKTKILEKELNSKNDLKVKDINKYKPDEKTAIEDMISNDIITVNTKKIKGNSNIFKGQLNELISNFAVKYNTITVNGEKINISEEKMPSNKDEYPYTLATVDKKIYEKKFNVNDKTKFKNPKEVYSLQKGYYPKIEERCEEYYNKLLNIDYRTINEQELKESISPNVLFTLDGLSEYVQYVKDNKIVIEGTSEVQFPAIYYDGLEYIVRMKLDFEIKNSDTNINLLYMDELNGYKVKYDNTKYTVYIDAKMGLGIGETNALYNDNLPIVDLLLENQQNVMVRE